MSEFNNMMQASQKFREENAKKYKKSSKERLQKIVESKMKTTMVGAIAAIEEKFGVMWGHGQDTMTENEKVMYEAFQELRNQIFDNGNKNIRAVKEEFDQYEIEWKKYHIAMNVCSDEERNEILKGK